jgi:3-hydroxyisobutyrate dehydrogenase-like beta-hydroxyacid dehydrogenase
MGNRITYVGALGSAKLVKTATAMLAAVDTMVTVEVFNWARRAGIAPDVLHEALKDSQRYSESTQRICEKIESGSFKPRKSWMPKDIGFGLTLAETQGTPLPFTALAKQLFQVARANGVDGYEATGIACKVYELLNGEAPREPTS